MTQHLAVASGALAETARQLEDDRIDVTGLTQGVAGVVGAIPRLSPAEWSGPASLAYADACDQVARDCSVAIGHLHAADNLLLAAIAQLGQS